MNRKTCLLLALGSLISAPVTSMAQSCLPYLTINNTNVKRVQMVTLNRNGLGSSSRFRVTYSPSIEIVQGVFRPPSWSIGSAKVLFSDRYGNVGGWPQPYSIGKADNIGVHITVEASPLVTETLNSWGYVKARFRATCTASGILRGSTRDVEYLLHLTQ